MECVVCGGSKNTNIFFFYPTSRRRRNTKTFYATFPLLNILLCGKMSWFKGTLVHVLKPWHCRSISLMPYSRVAERKGHNTKNSASSKWPAQGICLTFQASPPPPSWALLRKCLWSPGIDSSGWESIPGLLKRFTNKGSGKFLRARKHFCWLWILSYTECLSTDLLTDIFRDWNSGTELQTMPLRTSWMEFSFKGTLTNNLLHS
jgi:hypothetical protein